MNLLAEQKTKFVADEKIAKEWILIDAADQNLGRLAGRIVHRLRGKHRVDYSPHQDIGDFVVVINAGKVAVTGKKLDQKTYYRHSGYPGGMRTFKLRERLENDPIFALKTAVKRMLPKGKLGRELMRNFKVYPGTEHPHTAQKPRVWEPTFK